MRISKESGHQNYELSLINWDEQSDDSNTTRPKEFICNPQPICTLGYYFNDLGCDCWPIPGVDYVCDIAEVYPNPREYCTGGFFEFAEFMKIWPAWATRTDIEKSLGTNLWEWPGASYPSWVLPKDSSPNSPDEQPKDDD